MLANVFLVVKNDSTSTNEKCDFKTDFCQLIRHHTFNLKKSCLFFVYYHICNVVIITGN